MLRNLSPIIFAPAETSAADGNCLHLSNQAAISGYFFKSSPSSYDQKRMNEKNGQLVHVVRFPCLNLQQHL